MVDRRLQVGVLRIDHQLDARLQQRSSSELQP